MGLFVGMEYSKFQIKMKNNNQEYNFFDCLRNRILKNNLLNYSFTIIPLILLCLVFILPRIVGNSNNVFLVSFLLTF